MSGCRMPLCAGLLIVALACTAGAQKTKTDPFKGLPALLTKTVGTELMFFALKPKQEVAVTLGMPVWKDSSADYRQARALEAARAMWDEYSEVRATQKVSVQFYVALVAGPKSPPRRSETYYFYPEQLRAP